MTQPANHPDIQLTQAERDLIARTTLDVIDITFTPPTTQLSYEVKRPLEALLTGLVQRVVRELYFPTKGD